jgi:hypothetical protein
LKNRIEYVISGTTHTKITIPLADDPTLIDVVRKAITRVNTFSDNSSFGILYNAMTEKNLVERILRYEECFSSIHSDSGGLQVMQQGRVLDESLLSTIFANQVNGSHVAMSFDSIPIKIVGPGDPRTNMAIKRYIASENLEHGIKSGKYLRAQLEYFANNPTRFNCKPLVILQGNSLQDYQVYHDAIMSQVPAELHSGIGGYAIAGSAIGIGALEALDSIYSFDCLEKPDVVGNRLHFLGYGSISRLAPVIICNNAGVLSKNHLSYDSTTHSSKYNMGSVTGPNLKDMEYGKIANNPKAKRIFGMVYDCFADILAASGYARDEWVNTVASELVGSEKFHIEDTKAKVAHLSGVALSALYSAKNFMSAVDSISADPQKLYEYPGNKKSIGAMLHLLECKSGKEWFKTYRPRVARYITSDRIERVEDKEVSFEDLFI